MKKYLSLLSLVAFFPAAQAHVVLETPVAEVGQYYRAALKVGHGCNGSATREFSVDIPKGVQGAKPQPKAGWRIDIERVKLDVPYLSHGKEIKEEVSRITWRAKTADDYLPDAYYEEFVVVAKLPETAGRLFWPSHQVCEQGRNDWVELPAEGTKPKFPAAALEVKPKQKAEAGHQH